MTTNSKALLTALYGIWLAVAGILRFVQAGSKPALGFGVTTGILALVGALLLYKNKSRAATILIAITLLFVVGFFVSKSIKEGFDVRVAITLLASVVEGAVLLLPARAIASEASPAAE